MGVQVHALDDAALGARVGVVEEGLACREQLRTAGTSAAQTDVVSLKITTKRLITFLT